jgi:hypothetical protein
MRRQEIWVRGGHRSACRRAGRHDLASAVDVLTAVIEAYRIERCPTSDHQPRRCWDSSVHPSNLNPGDHQHSCAEGILLAKAQLLNNAITIVKRMPHLQNQATAYVIRQGFPARVTCQTRSLWRSIYRLVIACNFSSAPIDPRLLCLLAQHQS